MSPFYLLAVAISLAMDAFAMAMCSGMVMPRVRFRQALTFGFSLGFFQGLMPVIGYLLSMHFARYLQSLSHWIAFFSLSLVGLHMLREALSLEERSVPFVHTAGSLLVLSLATSIDALAMGVTFAVMAVPVIPAALTIGAVTLILSTAGVYVGHQFGLRYRSKAEMAGGLVLLLLGAHILMEELGFF